MTTDLGKQVRLVFAKFLENHLVGGLYLPPPGSWQQYLLEVGADMSQLEDPNILAFLLRPKGGQATVLSLILGEKFLIYKAWVDILPVQVGGNKFIQSNFGVGFLTDLILFSTETIQIADFRDRIRALLQVKVLPDTFILDALDFMNGGWDLFGYVLNQLSKPDTIPVLTPTVVLSLQMTLRERGYTIDDFPDRIKKALLETGEEFWNFRLGQLKVILNGVHSLDGLLEAASNLSYPFENTGLMMMIVDWFTIAVFGYGPKSEEMYRSIVLIIIADVLDSLESSEKGELERRRIVGLLAVAGFELTSEMKYYISSAVLPQLWSFIKSGAQ